MTTHDPQMTYRDAGVDIDAGAALVERIKPLAAATARPGVVSSIGGFGALFELPLARYQSPLVVATTDGVGTKLRLALDAGRHDSVGIDLVAMCANDISAQGAEPLFFLDYFATGRLEVDVAEAVVRGIAEGCRRAGIALIGGETAEMPGMYRSGDYDLAGFCVGIVERDRVVDGRRVVPGDRLIGLASSGPHSNGYSLIRRILEVAGADLDAEISDRPLGDALLEPTRIYVRDVEPLLAAGRAKGIAHITGGGLLENVARILPPGVGAVIERARWTLPPVFRWLQAHGRVADAEMHRTFNCGVGLVIAVDPQHVEESLGLLAGQGVDAFEIGVTVARADGEQAVVIR